MRKSPLALVTLFAACLLSASQAIAQQPPMQVPMAPQAIESQMQQKRTLEQREAIEAKKNQPATAAKPTAAVAAPASTTADCESKAVGKNGKALAGAAKAAFMKKCEEKAKGAESDCESKAVSKDGKPLTGSAKAASIKKCESEPKAKK